MHWLLLIMFQFLYGATIIIGNFILIIVIIVLVKIIPYFCFCSYVRIAAIKTYDSDEFKSILKTHIDPDTFTVVVTEDLVSVEQKTLNCPAII